MDLLSMLQTKAAVLNEEVAKSQVEKEKQIEELEKQKEKTQSKDLADRVLKRKKKQAEKIRLKLEERKKNEKKALKRKIAAKELLTTETTYVKNLMILINGFVLPLETKGILNSTEIASLFANVKVLLKFHKEFLKSLKERMSESEEEGAPALCLGDLILQMSPYLKMYTKYGTNYDTALATLQQLQKHNPRFSSFLQENLESPTFGGLTLSGYLIMPIQRIPRYRLLIEVIIQNTQPSHPDYENLQKALNEVESVALSVNDAIEKESSMNTLIKIQGMVNLQIVVPARKFIREGVMKSTCFEKKKKKKLRSSSEIVVLASSPDINGERHAENGRRLITSLSLRKLPRDNGDAEPPLLEATRSASNLHPPTRSTSVSDLSALHWGTSTTSIHALPECNVYLCNDIIVLTPTKNKSKAIAPKLVTTWVKTSEIFPKAFELVTLDGTYLMVLKDSDEKDSWVKSIRDAIAELDQKPDQQEIRDQYETRHKGGVWKVVSKNSPQEDDEVELTVPASPRTTILHMNPIFNTASPQKGSRASVALGKRERPAPPSPTLGERRKQEEASLIGRVRVRASTLQSETKSNTLL